MLLPVFPFSDEENATMSFIRRFPIVATVVSAWLLGGSVYPVRFAGPSVLAQTVDHVVFTRLTAGNADIWDLTLLPDRSVTERRLTDAPGYDDHAVPSHDGTKIAWLGDSSRELRVRDSDGSNQRLLARADQFSGVQFSYFAWSPDDQTIMVDSWGSSKYLCRIQPSDGQVLGTFPLGYPDVNGMQYSPDGKHVVMTASYGGSQEIARINADLTGYVVLDSRAPSLNPTYNHAGDRIVYDYSHWSTSELWTSDGDGNGKTLLLSDPPPAGSEVKHQFTWTPDDQHIIFARYPNAGSLVPATIETIDPDGQNHRVLSTPGNNILNYSSVFPLSIPGTGSSDNFGRNQNWTADGQRMVFMSDRDGNWEIYTMNADGTGQTRLTDNTVPDFNPLMYHAPALPETRTVVIDIKPCDYPNAINLGSEGVVPVAILSSETFDATQVDADTVTLAGAGVAVRGKGNKLMAHQEDVNSDGLTDLVLQVETQNLDPNQLQDGRANLSGSTLQGAKFAGSDEIVIVPPGQ
jgi:Tol biopolymer transport system component